MNPLPLVRACYLRNPFTATLFVVLIALAMALGIAISAQERALRQGSARAADRFDLIVAAPGSQTDLLFSTVYLRPTAVELLPATVAQQVLNDPGASFAAPIGFGDSHDGMPVIGTTAEFVLHLSGGLAEGRPFATIGEAVVGALTDARVGERITIRHGHADDLAGGGDADSYQARDRGVHGDDDHAADAHDDDHAAQGTAAHGDPAGERAHGDAAGGAEPGPGPEGHGPEGLGPEGHGQAEAGAEAHDDHEDHAGDAHLHEDVTVVGRMQPTGTPWDRAVVVPIEYVWFAHAMGTGHAIGDDRIGPPWDPALLPGLPAIVVKPETLAAAYGLRSRYRTEASTAFFPAEVLVDLYALMGDAARIMAMLTLAAQALVVAAILAGLLAILDLQRRRFAVLRALGAPAAYVFAVVWLYVGGLIVLGALIGLPLGWAAAGVVSRLVTDATGVAMTAGIGLRELRLVGALLGLGLVLALVPAVLIYRRPVVAGLR